jgi:hypothetical protein
LLRLKAISGKIGHADASHAIWKRSTHAIDVERKLGLLDFGRETRSAKTAMI